jgi:hypothetical protein
VTIAWRIDTFDARSGYAFTSRRIADLDSPSALADGIDTFFIEAPHFIPERVSSQAIAFGAARASCNAPGKIGSALREQTLELALFAACYLNASDVDRWEADNFPVGRYWHNDKTLEKENSYNALSALKLALPWIRRSLPHYAFASTVEEAIASTARQERQADGPEPIIAL